MSVKRFFIFLCALILPVMLGCGCGPKVPREVARQVTWTGDFKTLQAEAETHAGEFVMVGGRIIATKNFPDKSEIAVLQFPLDASNRPQPEKPSGGRFLIRSKAFIDPEIYAPGKLVTAAGRLAGAEKRMIGEYEYAHPVVKGDFWVFEPRENSFPRFHFGVGIGKTF